MQMKVKELRSLIREAIEETMNEDMIDFGQGPKTFDSQVSAASQTPMVNPNAPSPKLADLRADLNKIHIVLTAAKDPKLVRPETLAQIQQKIGELKALVGVK